MNSITVTTSAEAMERLLEPLRHKLTPEAARLILEIRADAELQARIEDLAERNTEDALLPEERQEYEALARAGTMLSILQAKARQALAARNGS